MPDSLPPRPSFEEIVRLNHGDVAAAELVERKLNEVFGPREDASSRSRLILLPGGKDSPDA